MPLNSDDGTLEDEDDDVDAADVENCVVAAAVVVVDDKIRMNIFVFVYRLHAGYCVAAFVVGSVGILFVACKFIQNTLLYVIITSEHISHVSILMGTCDLEQWLMLQQILQKQKITLLPSVL